MAEKAPTAERGALPAEVLDEVVDAIIVSDMQDRLLYWNNAAEETFGWSLEEAREVPLPRMAAPEDGARLAEARGRLAADGRWEGELEVVAKDGRRLALHLRMSLIRDAAGTPVARMVSARDLTEQHSLQAQLLRAQRVESIGMLASGIAHDLNNALSPILMAVETIGISHRDPQTLATLDIIRKSAQRGAGIVRQVLGFARGLGETTGEIQARHIIKETEQILTRTFPPSIEIRARVARDLLPVRGDATQLSQVLMNLCVNARDAMPDGGRLSITAENVKPDEGMGAARAETRPPRYVRISVEDTGSGIPRDIKEKIFDPFFTTKAPDRGTGLGLSTSLSIVKSYGGFIDVDTAVGRGSSFNVFFPAAVVPAVEGEAQEEPIPLGEGELVLVIDDESAMREITRQALESYGYTVATAHDGTEAVAMFAEHGDEVAAVIVDVMMPFMDGAATVKALRRMDPGVKVIVISGVMAGSDGTTGMNGMRLEAFLAKPFTAQVLLQTLARVLDGG
jgi:two-component system, cell cycle sensor histidine kinase and response regulator CckA